MTSEDNIEFENELKKIKLNLEHGMTFHEPEGSEDTPPEVMHDFLDYVEEYEKGFKNAKQVTVSEFLGHPVWRKEAEIGEDEIEAAVDAAMALLEKHGVVLNVIYEVEVRELYRFITEDLIEEEIDDMRIPGMTQNFIYEEFHPNHEMDIRKRCEEFFNAYFDKSRAEFGGWELTKEMKKDPALRNFRDAFDRFETEGFEITSLHIDGIHAKVEFAGEFTGFARGDSEGMRFGGKGLLELEGEDDWWQICAVELPPNIPAN